MHRLASRAVLRIRVPVIRSTRSPRVPLASAAATTGMTTAAVAASAAECVVDPRFVGPPQPGESILIAAQRVLRAASPDEKAALSDAAWALFQAGQLALPPSAGGPPLPADLPPPPTKPARDGRVTVLPPQKVKRLKKGGTVESRAAILHALAHIENWAVDVFWDILARCVYIFSWFSWFFCFFGKRRTQKNFLLVCGRRPSPRWVVQRRVQRGRPRFDGVGPPHGQEDQMRHALSASHS
jgi:hypothetical protein